jgi:hypothetical protein
MQSRTFPLAIGLNSEIQIGGVTAKDIVDFYIVIMAQPIPKSNWVAISLIETCLEPYDVQRGRMDSLGTMPDGSDS